MLEATRNAILAYMEAKVDFRDGKPGAAERLEVLAKTLGVHLYGPPTADEVYEALKGRG